MQRSRSLITVLGLSVMMLIGTFSLVLTASAQTGGNINQIVIRPQDTHTGQIMVDSVTAAQDGWLLVYTDTRLSPSTLVGWAPIHKGLNTNLKVDINRELVEPYATLWAVLHVDRGAIGLLEPPVIDGPVQQDGKTVVVAFDITGQGATTATPQVSATSAPAVAPKLLPPAGGTQRPWAGWLVAVCGAVGLGSLLLVVGMALRPTKARAQSPSDQEKQVSGSQR